MTMGNDQSGERDSFRNIETYARLKMDELGLADWQFGWDRAKRRLGVCRLLEKSITISIHFVRANLETPHEIRDTIHMRSPTPWRGPATENAPTDRDGNKFAGK